jgi:pseudomonalisin
MQSILSPLARISAARSLRAFRVAPLAIVFTLTAAASAQTWTPTATQALTLVNATSLGTTPASTPVHVVLAMRVQNKPALDALVKAVNQPGNAQYENFITPQQFNQSYAPTSSQVNAVSSYLQSKGFSNIAVEANNLFVSADGTAAQASAAFNTTLQNFSQNGQTVFANVTGAQVPTALGSSVGAVLGLNNISAMHPFIVKQTTGPSAPQYLVSYGPQQFQQAYDAGSTPTGSKTPIAIFMEGNLSQVTVDLRTFEQMYSLPQVPYTIVPTGIASTDTSGQDEWDLDSQYSTGIAGNVKMLYMYDATSLTDSDLAIAFNRFVTDNKAKNGNASFGECDVLPYLDGSMFADDQTFEQAAAQGQTIFASTGDTGSSCAVEGTNGVPGSGPPMTSYPSSSPYVVAVGGTTLLTNSDGSYDQEIAWYAGGGGISLLESGGYWQNGIVPGYTAGKGLPDVAMDADPESGANVIVSGVAEGVGGTSLASPLAMGTYARLQSAHNNKLGFASPLLYTLASPANTSTGALPSVKGFHDIILGVDGIYSAAPGWDYTTGLGTFDISAVNALVK